MNKKQSKIVRITASYFIIAIMAVVIIYPLVWVFGASLTPGTSISSSSIIPDNPTWSHYKELFNSEESLYLTWYWNTIKVSILSMLASVITISLMAYSFSRYQFVGRKNGLVTFLILQMIPNFAALIAIFVLANVTGLINTHLGLILIYIGGAIPMNTWLMKGYLETIPKELDESARMDGAGHFRIFWQIIMPLAKPMIAVVAVFSFITPFTDFILAKVLLRQPEQYTLAVGLYELVSRQYGSEFTLFAAGSILIAVPIAILFLSLQKYFVSGLTAGGIKG
ncbi:Maltose transport system permease protein MalG [Oceanobacillus picturae]|jgi:arabinogalactan oligomer / maltooligosaccharide transport system permease protein|uniref:Maltose transport system permease protein MalG n=1 Tax=Oceanobacillus picturae TaxID=171693 RepID=W9ACW6_9BACI|nr:sugar ABC transporter permease [Oceanobacillus picturae]RIU91218.1 sugar ABC transporter permease [Oceanobacillus picturae]CDO03343.1 Maltose transport system permease protein MalG [Oceanobacillus picturae]